MNIFDDLFNIFETKKVEIDLNTLDRDELIRIIKNYREEYKKLNSFKTIFNEGLKSLSNNIKDGLVEGLKPYINSIRSELNGFTINSTGIKSDINFMSTNLSNITESIEDLKNRASIITDYNDKCDKFNQMEFEQSVLDSTSKSKFCQKFDPFLSDDDTIDTVKSNLQAQNKYIEHQKLFNDGFNSALSRIYYKVPLKVYNKYIKDKVNYK